MSLKAIEKIKMFRCVQDPMIGPKPKQAFMLPDLPGWEAEFYTSSGTISVKTSYGRRHLVGPGNWSSIELYPEEVVEEKKPGRPKAVSND